MESGRIQLFIIIISITLLGRDSNLLGDGRNRNQIPVGARFFTPVQTSPRAQTASYKTGPGPFLMVKQLERGINHPSHWSAKIKKRSTAIRLLSPCAFRTGYRVNSSFITFLVCATRLRSSSQRF